MLYLIIADIVTLLHFLWIVFLIVGVLAGRRHTWIRRLHIAGLLFAITIQVFGWYCPLTHLETWLRTRYDPSLGYSGSFIIQYVEKIVYIELRPEVILIFTLIIVFISAYVYVFKP